MPDVSSPPEAPSLPIADSAERFYLRRVYCVGRNYADHTREMGNDPDREPPFFFSKPVDSVFATEEGVPARGVAPYRVPYPPQTTNLHFEMELVVAIGRGGADLEADDALSAVWGYAAGVDLTRRDLQSEAKSLRRPWDLSKGFDFSGPCSAVVRADRVGHPDSGAVWLEVDGQARQRGDLADQIWPVRDVIAELSRFVRLMPGDLIFTGTPAGVGAVVAGDTVTGGVEGVGELRFQLE